MNFIPVLSPDGNREGWIRPELVVSIGVPGHYFKYRDGDQIRDGVLPSGLGEEFLLRACGINA